FHPVEAAILDSQRVAEALRAPGDRVLVDVVEDRRARGLLELQRRGEVGEALRQVDRVVLRGEPRHFADHALREFRGLGGDESAAHDGVCLTVRFSKRVYSLMNASFTSPVGPVRFLPTMMSQVFLSAESRS